MNRNQYLQSIKNGLAIFEESYQQEIILELDEKINMLLTKGKKEEEVISSLESVDDFLKKIYAEHHVRFHDTKKSNFFSTKTESIFEVIHRIIDVMSKNSARANGKILFDILILIFLVCIIKIPFLLVRDLVHSLLAFFSLPILITIWDLFVEIIYIIIAVFVFFNIFKRWFQNLKISKS